MRTLALLLLLLGHLAASASSVHEDPPVVREALRDITEPSRREQAWKLLAQVQMSLRANQLEEGTKSCFPVGWTNSSGFVVDQLLTRVKKDIQFFDLIVYEDGTNNFEIFIRTDKPQAMDLVARIMEDDGSCVKYELQIRLIESGGANVWNVSARGSKLLAVTSWVDGR